jgi:hypothetical protein
MATLEDLPADQRAVLSLVLTQGRSYDEIAAALSIDRAGVRERALAALDALSPETTTTPALQRALITDYLLGQLPPPVAEQTRLQLERSRPDREWARAAAGHLAPLASAPLPVIWDAETDGAAPAPSGATPAPDGVAKPSSRRGGALLLAGLGVALLAGIAVALVALLGGSSGGSAGKQSGASNGTGVATTTSGASTATTHASTPFSSPTAPTTSSGSIRVLTRLALLPARATAGHRTAGIAEIVRDGAQTGIVLVAQGLAANTSRNAYAVWLASPAGTSAFLGFVSRLVTANGKLTADGTLPADAARYSRVLLTLETRSKPTTPGEIVLEGAYNLPG